MYKVVSVFDVSQTDGKPLPVLASDLQGNVQNYEVFIEALKRSAPVPLAFEQMAANMKKTLIITNGLLLSRARTAMPFGMSCITLTMWTMTASAKNSSANGRPTIICIRCAKLLRRRKFLRPQARRKQRNLRCRSLLLKESRQCRNRFVLLQTPKLTPHFNAGTVI